MTKIMLVDDEPDIRYLMKRKLEREQYEVVEADSGEECLNKIKQEKPDLILLDIMMPGMSGWETLECIKEMEDTAEILIIIFTVMDVTPEAMSKKEELGFVDYIVKPFDYNDLLKRIQMAMGRDEDHERHKGSLR